MATGSKLVIVESPTKAKKIGGYLGSGYTVMASVGHIRDLAQPSQVPAAEKAKYGKFGVDIEDGFKPYYIVDGNKKKTVADLKSALKKADTLYLATDEDREGEAIAWHLVQTLKPKVPVKRMVFHEITPEAIKASLNNTRDVDAAMVDAQETRRILDRLYGYELSPVLWRKVGPGLSAGRVQSVATRLIVERERERMAFVRAPYWDVTATLEAPDADGNNVAFDSRMVSLGGRRLAGSKDFGDDGQLTARRQRQRRAAGRNARECDRAIAGICDVHRLVDGNQAVPSPSGAAVHHVHVAADGRQSPWHELAPDHACRAGAVRKRFHHVYAYRFGDAVAGGDRGRP